MNPSPPLVQRKKICNPEAMPDLHPSGIAKSPNPLPARWCYISRKVCPAPPITSWLDHRGGREFGSVKSSRDNGGHRHPLLWP